jgi:glucose-1-phosphate thymidylyltransferase
MKVVIPMAGFGSRMRPLTWSRPKQLLQIANQTMLEHVFDMLSSLPSFNSAEFIFIIGYLGDPIKAFMDANYPELNVHYVTQSRMRGQSEAIYLARDLLDGPMIMVYPDTYLETDLSFLAIESSQAVTWARPIEDPRSFGVALLKADGRVDRLIEKPDTKENNLVVMGLYYFADSARLLAAIERQFAQDIRLNDEFFLADAINLMLEEGLDMRVEPVEVWLDSGKPQNALEMNRWLLDHGRDNSAHIRAKGSKIVPPVFVHPSAVVSDCTLGPHAAIGPRCTLSNSTISDSIVEAGSCIQDADLQRSLIGEKTALRAVTGEFFVGDSSVLTGNASRQKPGT